MILCFLGDDVGQMKQDLSMAASRSELDDLIKKVDAEKQKVDQNMADLSALVNDVNQVVFSI